jgi:large repetitive protein
MSRILRTAPRLTRLGSGFRVRLGSAVVAGALATATLPLLTAPASAVEVPDGDFTSEYSIQTNGPGGAITLGDYYSAPTASGGSDQPHLIELNVPCSWPTGTPLYVDLYSAGFNSSTANPGWNRYEEPGADANYGTASYVLRNPGGTTVATQSYAPFSAATDSWTRFATLGAPVACGTYALSVDFTGDDQNGWRLRFGTDNDGNANNAPPANYDNPDGVAGTDDEVTAGLTRISYQHDLGGTTARCLTLYEYVNPNLASVSFHNFDLDNVSIPGSTVRYYAPGAPFDPTGASGGVVGDISGNGVWNNPGGAETTTRAGDVITAAQAPDPLNPSAVRSGWWRILTCASDHNQFIQEAQTGEPVYFQQPPTPQLTVAKTDGTTVLDPGQTTTYTVTITNTSNTSAAPGAATSVVANDTLPAGLTPVSCALGGGAAGTCARVGTSQVMRATFTDEIPAGASRTFTVVATVVATGAPSSFTNSVSVAYNDSLFNPFVPVTATDVDTLASANLGVTKTASGSFTVGNPGAYTISVSNAGPDRARSVRVVDTLPTGLTYTSVSAPSPWTCAAAGQTVTCDLTGDLASGGTSAFTLNVAVGAGAFPSTTNPATVSSATRDLTTANNSTSATTPVAGASIGDRVFDDTDGDGVQDAGEPGRNGVTVTLLASDATTVLRTTTTATVGGVVGSYAFTGLAPGTYVVRFTAPSGRVFTLADTGADDAVDSDASRTTGQTGAVVLTAGQAVTDVDAGTVPPASIGNLVFDDRNGNGAFDAGDAPLAGRTVTLSQGAVTVATATTAADGSYLFANLVAGTYTVSTPVPTGFSATGPAVAPATVVLDPGENDLAQDFGFQQTNASIGDRVWNDADGDGVQDAGEPGVGGVTLTLRRGTTVVATTTTNAAGAYLFPGLPAGDYTVTATDLPTGFTATTPNPVVVTGLVAGELRDTADVGIRQTNASIGDRVYVDADADGVQDAGETGLAGVTVTLSGGPTSRPAQVTDASGLYSFTGLAAGTYTVTITVPSGYTATVPATGSGTFTVTPGQARTDADFGVQQTDGSIGDLVFNDVDGSGTFTPGDLPLDNRVVTLTRGGTQVAQTTTNASGAYLFSGLAAGDYVVTVTTPNGFTPTGPATSPAAVSLAAGEAETGVDFGFRQTNASIGDTVFLDLDADGAQDTGETGRNGVTVQLYDATGVTLLATTVTAPLAGVDGRYAFTGLPAGSYRVVVVPPTGFVVTTTDPLPVTVTAGQSLTTADLGILQSDGSIGDTVFTDLDGNGLLDGLDTGRPGVTVELRRDGVLVDTAITGPGGAYTFTGLPAGDYAVTVVVPTGFSATTPNPVPVALAAGEAETGADVGLQQTDGAIGDLVYVDADGDGTPDAGEVGLPGRTVELYRGTTLLDTAVTDADGAYLFTGLAAGTYSVRIATPNGFTATGPARSPQSVELTAGESDLSQDFGFVQSSGSIGDTVFVDADGDGTQDPGEPARAGVTVTLTGPGPDGLPRTVSTTTGLDGTYAFTGLRAGDYTVTVTPPTGFRVTTTATVPVTLAAGQALDTADFGVQQADASLSGTVFDDADGDGTQDPTEPGLAGLTVTATSPGEAPRTTTTGSDGGYAFTGLPAGTWTVDVTVPSGRTVTTPPEPRAVPVAAGADVGDVDFGLQVTTGAIGDLLYVDEDGDGTRDAGEPGLAGVQVTLTAPGQPTRTTTSATDGSYSFTGLAAGTYTVTVAAQTGFTTPPPLVVDLAEAESDLTADRPFAPAAGTIGDLVFNDVDADGVPDAGEAGYPGVTVTLYAADGTTVLATTTTDSAGFYAFTGLPSTGTTYVVDVTGGLPAGLTETGAGAPRTTTLTAASPSDTGVDFGYVQNLGSLGDTVYADRDGDGVQDVGEPGVSGVPVSYSSTASSGSTTTGPDGRYSFLGLAPGSYTVTVTAPAGSALTTPATVTRTITLAGEAFTDADFGLAQGRVGDLVFLDTDADGDAEEGGYATPVTLTLTGGGLASPLTTTTTAVTGAYAFTGLPDGTYTVTLTVPGGAEATAGTTRTATVTGGAAVLDADFGLRTVTGTIGDRVWNDLNGDGVQDPGEPGLQGGTVVLTDDGPDGLFDTPDDLTTSTTSAADGSYSFGGLSAGDFRVSFTPPAGFVATTSPTTVTRTLTVGQSDADVDFGARQSNASIGDLVFVDVDGDGVFDVGTDTGLAGVVVRLTGPGGVDVTDTTDADGLYLFTGLLAGTYTVDVQSALAGYTATTPDPRTVTVVAGQPLRIADFGYQPTSAAISGTVFRDNEDDGAFEPSPGPDAGIDGVTVTLLRDGAPYATTTTASGGQYAFSGLPAGSYAVTVGTPAGTAPSTPTSVPVTVTTTPVTGVDIGFAPATASIGDTVVNDLDGDGVAEAGEPGLQGVVVTLTDLGRDGAPGGGDDVVITTTTGPGGAYAFTGLTPGDYVVAVTAPTGFAVTGPGTDAVSLAAGATVDDADFTVRQSNASIGDTVWVDVDGDGVLEAGETGLAGVTLTLSGSGFTGTRTTTSGAGGAYSFTGLPAGTYSVDVTPPPGYAVTTSDPFTTSLAAGQQLLIADFGLREVPGAVTGTVFTDTDAGGTRNGTETGRAGVTVTLRSGTTVVATDTTDLGGGYSFGALPLGDYTVTVTVPGSTEATTPTVRSVSLTTGAPTASDQDFGVAPATSSIGDRVWADVDADGVQDAGEPGRTGITVTLSRTGTPDRTTTTGAGGAYGFTGLTAGTYTVTVTVPSTSTATTTTTRTVVLGADEAVTDADFGLLQTNASIGDLVYDDANGNGSRDPGELGIGGVVLTLSGGPTTAAPVTTLADGSYAFTGLAAGTYVVDVQVPAGRTATTPDPRTVTVAAGQSVITADFGLRTTSGSVTGSVFSDVDGDGTQDAGEPDRGGVTVTLTQGATTVATTVSQADGTYSFPGLPAGTYSVTVTVPTGTTATSPTTGSVTVGTGAASGPDFALEPVAGTIGDVVFDDANGDGTQDAGEAGLGGVTVTLTRGGTAVDATTTAADGSYAFTGLPAGTYVVTVTVPTGRTATTPSTITVDLAADEVDLTADVGLQRTDARIGDLVWDDLDQDGVRDAGEPGRSGATVTLTRGATTVATTSTDATGAYQFSGLPAGSYTVTVTPPTGTVASTPAVLAVALAEGQSVTDADVGIASGTIGDLVFDDVDGDGVRDAGEPGLAGVTVTVRQGTTLVDSVVTGSDGSYVVPLLPAGTYVVTVTVPGGRAATTPASVTVDLAAGETDRTVDFGLAVSSNSAPVFGPAPTNTAQTVTVGSGLVPLTATDADGDPLTYAIQTGTLPPGIALAPNGTFTGTTTTPGTTTVVVDVTDGQGGSASTTLVVTVQPAANRPPVYGDEPTNDAQSTGVGGGLVPLTASDPDGQPLTFTVTSGSLPPGVNLGSDGNFSGTATTAGTTTAVITVSDGAGGTATTTLTVTVSATPNQSPVFSDASGNTAQTIPVGGRPTPVTAADPDPGQTVTYAVTGGTLPAGVTLAPDGTFGGAATTPGTTTVTITASDGRGGTDTTTLAITVTPAPDRAPVANDDTATTPAGAPVTTSVLANDTDPDGDALTVASLTQPANGTVTCTPSACTYTPEPGFSGTDTYTYTVSDGRGLTDTATVTVTVTPPANRPPAFTDAPANTSQTVVVGQAPVPLQATDPDGDPLTFTVTTGTLPAGITLNPDGSFSGTATTPGATTVTITVSDGRGGSDSTSIAFTIVVSAPGSSPVAVDDTATTTAGTPVRTVVLANDTDADPADVLTVLSWTQPANGSVTCVNGGPTPGCTYAPDAGFSGTDTYAYTVTDGTGRTDTATVTVTVTPAPNSAPVLTSASGNTSQTVPVGGRPVPLTATDADGDPLTFTVTAGALPPGIALGTSGTFTGAATTPGTYTVTVQVSDGRGGSDTGTLTITVVPPVQVPPVAGDDRASSAGVPVTVPVLANDTDANGDALTVSAFTQPGRGTVTCTASACTYVPPSGFTGTTTFTYTVSDGRGGTDTATVTVTVTAPNRPPVAVDDVATTDEDTPRVLALLGNDTDADGDPLALAVATQPRNGTVTCSGTRCTYTPAPGYSGPDSFTYTVSDGRGGQDTGTVTLTVRAVNDPPVARDDAATTGRGTPVTIRVLGNDSDADGAALAVVSVTQPRNGSVSCTATACTYTPDTGFTGTDAFTYSVSDGRGGTNTATVRVVVTAPSGVDGVDGGDGTGGPVGGGDGGDGTGGAGEVPRTGTDTGRALTLGASLLLLGLLLLLAGTPRRRGGRRAPRTA